jgi:hypothetical protein
LGRSSRKTPETKLAEVAFRRLVEQQSSRTLCGCKPQHQCSNPSKSPEIPRKVPKQKYDDLQVFCKLQKSPANNRATFTRQRSLVRTQHRPLQKSAVLQVKLRRSEYVGVSASFLLTTVVILTRNPILYGAHPRRDEPVRFRVAQRPDHVEKLRPPSRASRG